MKKSASGPALNGKINKKGSGLKSRIEKADALRDKARYKESIALLARAIRSCGPGADAGEVYKAHLLSGHNWRMLGNFEKAVFHYEKAISQALSPAPGDGEKTPLSGAPLLDAKVSLSLAYRAMGDWKKALSLLREAEKAYKKLKDEEALAFVLWSKGGTFRIKGDIGRAIDAFREARKIFRARGDLQAAGYCLNGLGGASRIKGAYKTSLAFYSEANDQFKRLKDPFGLAYSFCGTGNALRMAGRHEEALVQFRKALKVYKRIGDIVSSSYTLWSVSKSLMMTGRTGPALETLRQAERLFVKTGDPRGRIYCLLSEAELRLMAGGGQKAKAAGLAAGALELSRRHGFAIESCHAGSLLALIKGDAGRKDTSCYKKLGLKKPDFKKVPVNLP
ncbi:MAG: tetratricopeptide repeat protein [Nitrospiraceae bacterium]|nr:tetratricopeptide repeat protein [Nitrospiraceae bacterium]